ncbi:unnamed protein product [Arctogadus glacialis]
MSAAAESRPSGTGHREPGSNNMKLLTADPLVISVGACLSYTTLFPAPPRRQPPPQPPGPAPSEAVLTPPCSPLLPGDSHHLSPLVLLLLGLGWSTGSETSPVRMAWDAAARRIRVCPCLVILHSGGRTLAPERRALRRPNAAIGRRLLPRRRRRSPPLPPGSGNCSSGQPDPVHQASTTPHLHAYAP